MNIAQAATIEELFKEHGYCFLINKKFFHMWGAEALEFLDLLQVNSVRAKQFNNNVNFGFSDNSDLSFSERLNGRKPHK